MSDFESRADDASRALGNAAAPASGVDDIRRRLRVRRMRYVAGASTAAAVVLVGALVVFSRHDQPARVETNGSTSTSTVSVSTTAPTTTTVAPTPTTTIDQAVTTIPTVTTTTAPATPPPTVAPTPENVASTFFVAWVGNDDATLTANGAPGAVTAAKAARGGDTSGFAFSNCQGAAGSIYCTWVRTGERVVLRVDDTSTPHLVVEFSRHTLTAEDVADEFLTAWEFSNARAFAVLTNPAAAGQAEALAAHAHDPWQFDSCGGAAGSLYCTWRSGHASLVAEVGNVNPPPLVGNLEYKP